MECRLPQEKIDKDNKVLASAKHRKKLKLRGLQSLIGLLNFACLVVRPGRPFLRRLIDLTRNITNPFYFVKLTCEARTDLHAWSVFIQSFNRHAKLSKPIKDCNSLNLSFFLCLADASTLLTLSIFSCGSRHSILQESTSMQIYMPGQSLFSLSMVNLFSYLIIGSHLTT
jgi:hypothetical protein